MRIERNGLCFEIHPEDVAAVERGDFPSYVYAMDDGTVYIGGAVCDVPLTSSKGDR